MYEKLLRYIIKLNQWRKKHISQNNFLIIAAAIVGALGGFAASVLKFLTHHLAYFLQNDFHWEYKYYLIFFFPLIGISLTILYIKTFIRKHPFEKSIPPIIKSISHKKSKLDLHNAYSQIITSVFTIGFGGSAGLESPSVFSGAAMGSNIGRWFGLSYRETTLLLACGGAAGIAGAFNGPVAGMVFAAEVLLPTFSIPAFIPLLIASAVASVVSKLLNSEPLFAYVTSSWDFHVFWIYVAFGVLAGFYSAFYSWLDEFIHNLAGKIKNIYTKVILGGLALGVLITLFPAVYGEGYINIQQLLNGNYQSLLTNSLFSTYHQYTWILIGFAALTLLGKTFGCVITMSSGGNGGMFGPSVVIGGLLGFVFAFTVNQLGIAHLNVTHFMIAGMAASVSGVMHAPLTGVFLSAEITGGYVLMVPLMVVSAISFFINKGVRKYSIYTKVLANQGSLVSDENQDLNVLRHIRLRYLIEKDFVILKLSDTPLSREKDIIHTHRTVFPVVGDDGKLLGILHIEQLLEHIVSNNEEKQTITIEHIVQPIRHKISIHSRMKEVMHTMDKTNQRILPVVDDDDKYLGFVTKNGIFTKYRKHLIKQKETL